MSEYSRNRPFGRSANQKQFSQRSPARARQAVLGIVLFYILLFIIGRWYPLWTGYQFKSDWALLLAAALPLVIFFFYIGYELFTTWVSRVSQVEIEFEKTIAPDVVQSVTFDMDLAFDALYKGERAELDTFLRDIARLSTPPKILLVTVDPSDTEISFPVLRNFIYEIIKVAPLEFIVFIGGDYEYLGFITLDKFRARYPKHGIETFIDDLTSDEQVRKKLEGVLPKVLLDSNSVRSMLDDLVNGQWYPGRDYWFIRKRDLRRLGVSTSWISIESTPLQAYKSLIENDLSGLPVVSELDRKFRGIVLKDNVVKEVILYILEHSKSQ